MLLGVRDYVADITDAITEQQGEAFFETFNNCYQELEILPKAYLENKVVVEEVEVKSSGKGIFSTIIEWIRRILNKFSEMAKSLFENNKEWFQENSHRFDKISDNAYANIKVTIIPYWKASYTLVQPALQDNDQRLGKDNAKTDEEIGKLMYPKFKGLSMSGDIIEGGKIWYRGGSNNLVSLSGSDVKNKVKEMLDYCNNYVSRSNNIKEELEKNVAGLEKADTELQKVRENTLFCYLEGRPVTETVYGGMYWENAAGETFLLEAKEEDKAKDPKKGKKGSGKSDKPPENNGGVQSTNASTAPANETEEQKKLREEKEKKEKDAAIGGKEAIKKYWQIKIKADATLLTVAEERYHAYVRTLRGILQEVGHQTVDKDKPKE